MVRAKDLFGDNGVNEFFGVFVAISFCLFVLPIFILLSSSRKAKTNTPSLLSVYLSIANMDPHQASIYSTYDERYT
jgi:hypothetical protein